MIQLFSFCKILHVFFIRFFYFVFFLSLPNEHDHRRAAQQHEQHRPPVYEAETPYKRLCEEEQYYRQYRQHRIHGFLDSVAPRLIFFYVLIDLFIFIVRILAAVF